MSELDASLGTDFLLPLGVPPPPTPSARLPPLALPQGKPLARLCCREHDVPQKPCLRL